MQTIDQFNFAGKKAFVRVDFNVPLDENFNITDDNRIRAALPTLKKIIADGGSLIIGSHLGRPKNEPDPAFSLKPVAARLSELLGKDVKFVSAAIGPEAEAARAAMKDGDVVLLENVRFYPGEKKNDPEFAKSLLGNATLFVNDAFGTAHRAHASTEGVTHFAEKSAMGFLIERELEYLEGKLENPEKPFVVIMGGAKVSDKIEVLSKLMEKADTFLIGGAMANTFLAAEGYDLGASKIEGDKLDLAREILAEAKAKGVVGHIGITAHLSQTFEKALKVDEIETIMFPYNIVEQQGKELIDRCAEKGKAFIDMKPLAGGAIEDGRLALRYVLSNPAVTVSIPGMAAPEELEQNVAGSANTAPLTPEEKAACQKVRDTLGTQFCRRCNYCAPCTVGIQIPSCFLFHGYLERYGLAGWAHERYDTLTVKAGACIGCGKCETRCPYNLPIRDMLKKVAQDFGE